MFLQPPQPFKSEGITFEQVSESILNMNDSKLLNLDLLTVIASKHDSIFTQMKSQNLVQAIVERILSIGDYVTKSGLSMAYCYSLLSQCLYHMSGLPLFLEEYADTLPL